ncbi:MAG: SLC13/DASS family transporter [Candidatus Neomarinimicrobiota bacterium]|nr:MAG: SLC13/DASS family transporter [Candidatus Neomarinimicrobiota bacterium]
MKTGRWAMLVTGPLLAGIIMTVFTLDPEHPEAVRTAGIAVWMAFWWITEAVPLAVTALLPVVFFPALGIMNGKSVAPLYFNHIIFLFLGGFLVALAMERWNLHRRIALTILTRVGASPRNILFGFMGATAFLSMWISNTATTMMMVPIALAIILNLEDHYSREILFPFATAIFLGIAYAASIGGIATLVGTPPNLVLARMLQILFPRAPEINFLTWMIFGVPLAVVFLLITWFFLHRRYSSKVHFGDLDTSLFQDQLRGMGPMNWEERWVLADFILLALLWITRSDLNLGHLSLPGWSRLFSHPEYINDGTVAIAMALVLFVVPTRTERGTTVLNWETARGIPWNIVLLFGGGFALAAGFKESGLAAWLGHHFTSLQEVPLLGILLLLALFVTFLTELTSNTATAQILIPILASLAVDIRIHPLFLLIPATLSCSFAFMLPVATPPNAIIFGTDRVEIRDMVRTGIRLNLIGALLITAAIYTIGVSVFHIDLSALPGWAVSP